MKKKIFFLILFLFILLMLKGDVKAETFGKVNMMKVCISPSSSAKLNMIYHIDIIVEKESLNEIKLKVPNEDFIVKSKCDLIKSITSDGNNYALITLNRNYNANEKISLTFNLLQSRLYSLNNSKNMCKFKFKMGYIENFEMNKIKIQWAKEKVRFCQSGVEQGKYYVIERNYSILRTLNLLVEYDLNTFKYEKGEEKEFTISEFLDNYFLLGLGVFIIISEMILYKKRGSRY